MFRSLWAQPLAKGLCVRPEALGASLIDHDASLCLATVIPGGKQSPSDKGHRHGLKVVRHYTALAGSTIQPRTIRLGHTFHFKRHRIEEAAGQAVADRSVFNSRQRAYLFEMLFKKLLALLFIKTSGRVGGL